VQETSDNLEKKALMILHALSHKIIRAVLEVQLSFKHHVLNGKVVYICQHVQFLWPIVVVILCFSYNGRCVEYEGFDRIKVTQCILLISIE